MPSGGIINNIHYPLLLKERLGLVRNTGRVSPTARLAPRLEARPYGRHDGIACEAAKPSLLSKRETVKKKEYLKEKVKTVEDLFITEEELKSIKQQPIIPQKPVEKPPSYVVEVATPKGPKYHRFLKSDLLSGKQKQKVAPAIGPPAEKLPKNPACKSKDEGKRSCADFWYSKYVKHGLHFIAENMKIYRSAKIKLLEDHTEYYGLTFSEGSSGFLLADEFLKELPHHMQQKAKEYIDRQSFVEMRGIFLFVPKDKIHIE